MEAELDLNDIIQEMHVVATMPDLYHLLVELNAVHSLLGLLSHENTDILHHGPPLPPTQTDQGFTSVLWADSRSCFILMSPIFKRSCLHRLRFILDDVFFYD